MVRHVVKPSKQVLLTLDRTHWPYGPTRRNLLCLGVVHPRVSIPIESMSLGRTDDASMNDPIHLLDRSLGYLPAPRCCLLADRECIGGDWLRHMLQCQEDFVICLRANHTMETADGRYRPLEHTTRRQPKNTTRAYENVGLYEAIISSGSYYMPSSAQGSAPVFGHQSKRFRRRGCFVSTALGG